MAAMQTLYNEAVRPYSTSGGESTTSIAVRSDVSGPLSSTRHVSVSLHPTRHLSLGAVVCCNNRGHRDPPWRHAEYEYGATERLSNVQLERNTPMDDALIHTDNRADRRPAFPRGHRTTTQPRRSILTTRPAAVNALAMGLDWVASGIARKPPVRPSVKFTSFPMLPSLSLAVSTPRHQSLGMPRDRCTGLSIQMSSHRADMPLYQPVLWRRAHPARVSTPDSYHYHRFGGMEPCITRRGVVVDLAPHCDTLRVVVQSRS